MSELLEKVRAKFQSGSYRPPTLPTVAMEVLACVQDPDVDGPRLARLLEKDPMLAAEVLRRVQSATFKSASKVTSLPLAIIRMGIIEVRDLVLQASLNVALFSGRGFVESRERLRVHSVAVGHLARLVAKKAGLGAENAFAAGLLHDVGIGAALILGEKMPGVDIAELWGVIDEAHAEASAALVTAWKLPNELIEGVRFHHLPSRGGSRLAALLSVSEQLARSLEFDFAPAEQYRKEGDRDTWLDDSAAGELSFARQQLGFSDEVLAQAMTEAQALPALTELRQGTG